MKATLKWIAMAMIGLLFIGSSVQTVAAQREKNTAKAPTYSNVISYFKTTEIQKRCTVFFEGEWASSNVYNYCLIIVENSDEDIQVTFYVTDAHEMNWITEFLDSPLFAPSETQALFELMNSGRDTKDRQLGRFRRVDFHHWKPRHAEILVFSFTPTEPSR